MIQTLPLEVRCATCKVKVDDEMTFSKRLWKECGCAETEGNKCIRENRESLVEFQG